MNPLLEQFISESREALHGISEKLMQLEREPESTLLMTELFRYVHTLKGNSGLFDFPELTRVLHAGEDLMDAVRDGKVAFSLQLADLLLDAMDFVGMLCDEIEKDDCYGASYAETSVRLAERLRQMLGAIPVSAGAAETAAQATPPVGPECEEPLPLATIPEQVRMAAYRAALQGAALSFIDYSPAAECFFQGDDPFFRARQTPGLLWGGIATRKPWPKLVEMDAYSCVLDYHLLSDAPLQELKEHYRYVSEQLKVSALSPRALILPEGDPNGGPVYDDFVCDALGMLQDGNLEALSRAALSMLELSNRELWLASALRWLLLVLELQPENLADLESIVVSLRSLSAPKWHEVRVDAAAAGPAGGGGSGLDAGNLSPEVREAASVILAVQREILSLPDDVAWISGRIRAAAASLQGCLSAIGSDGARAGLPEATECAVAGLSAAPLRGWLEAFIRSSAADLLLVPEPADTSVQEEAAGGSQHRERQSEKPTQAFAVSESAATTASFAVTAASAATTAPAAPNPEPAMASAFPSPAPRPAQPEAEVKFGRRADDAYSGAKSIKVDQEKIDRLMNLIGEMVVAKNALPYLAGRAETVFGVRELSREIKAQYAVINRIAEEMQDSIMQVRMMPVSFVFQRFPRLVRDTANKLAKKVNLVLEGEETEADKNIIESLGDPLVHIVRNSLDHGIESPELRVAAGKPAAGTLLIRASQEADRVIIEIRDDGKGIDPEVIKRKAYQKGIIDEDQLERITDQEAVNLVFSAGFSTAETISDLSGRGVGMDVVRTAIEKVNGTVQLESSKGKGTCIRIALPLSMAITNVMIVESDRKIFGVPMDAVVETVRVPRSAIKSIKKSMATVLRGRIVPLKGLNSLLGLAAEQLPNDEDELAVLVVSLGDESIGILVDDFHETVDIILKPMTGILAGLPAYSGSALLGDGSVLMVLNLKEVV